MVRVRFKSMNFIYLIAILFSLASCGDLFHTEEEKTVNGFQQFLTCELDTDAFSFILEKNIKGDIYCLKENLELFISTVETDKPGYISRDVLKEFIEFGSMDVDKDVLGLVDNVFDLSHVILGTDKKYIKDTDMNKLIDFLAYFNENIWKSYEYFVSKDPVNYERHIKERNTVFNEFSLIADYLKKIFINRGDHLERISLEDLVFNFFHGDLENLEKVRSMMFLKRVFFGGDKWELNQPEFAILLEKLPELAQVAFDLVKVEHYEFKKDQETLIKVFLADVNAVESALFFDESSHEAVFTIYDIINVFSIVAPEILPFDISKYPKELMKLKEIILGNGQEIVSAKELILAFTHTKNILNEADLFYRVYDFYRLELEKPDPISHDFSDFQVNNSSEQEFLKNFARIVHDYKFLKGEFTSAYYSFDYYRNANAYFQISGIEYLIKLVMQYYGSENTMARGGYDMTLSETVNVVDDFKWFLKDQGILKIGRVGGGEIANLADNFVLLSTLFQYQSDGCFDEACMEIPEITEFALGLFTALEVRDAFTEYMLQLCIEELDEFNRIAPSCFRKHFIDVLEAPILEGQKSIVEYMPYLYEYLKDLVKDIPSDGDITDSADYMTFITETENFTRSCTYYDEEETDEVYLKGDDAFAVFAGLLNVESTLLRFDLDESNTIDAKNSVGRNEVLNAYKKVYYTGVQPLVEGMVGNEMIAKLISKPVFQYLVKYGKVPSTDGFSSIWHFVKFILRSNKDADIERSTVSTILRVIGEQSENSKLHPYKCDECFRDPTTVCIPEDNDWDY